ncbi:unnamed protein product [Linum trigynum]|uniref:LSM12 LSM domain-containing protein n=1 Tax=Linum trigynum TaxID=586398 RepID=A0AAV2GWL4_9ROSI
MEGSSSSSRSDEDFAVGCMLSIKTTLGDEFDGQVVTFDRPSNILVLHILLSQPSFISCSAFSSHPC